MRRLIVVISAAMVLVFSSCGISMNNSIVVKELRCEYLVNPLGIDVVKPRLSWILESNQRGQKQNAYQILVAGSEENLKQDKGNLWDTGKVESDQSIHVIYNGEPLESHKRCYWKVRVWDKDGKVSGWSGPAMWSMGILTPEQWQGKWLGHTKTYGDKAEKINLQPLTFKGCQWIWYPEGDPRVKVPACKRYFRRTFTLPEEAKVKYARILLSADNQFVLYVNGEQASENSGKASDWERPQEIDLTKRLIAGRNVLAIEAVNTGASPAGVTGSLAVLLENGDQMTITTDGSWRTSSEKPAGWKKTDYNDSVWAKAKELGEVGIKPWGYLQTEISMKWRQKAPSPIFRKVFELNKSVKSASVYVCGLGYYELRLNGNKVGNHVLDPAFTRYDKRALYVTYDVTDKLRQSKNALCVMLGNGWYNMHTRATWDFDRAPWRDRPKILLQLHIEFIDGTTENIVSDSSWRASTGAVILDGIRNGETYDARLEMPGWDMPEFNDSGWVVPDIVAGPQGVLRAQMMQPIKVTQTITPIYVTEHGDGVFVFDMGQNFAGWAQLKVSGPAGTKVTMRYGERITANGMVSHGENIRRIIFQGPFQTDTYILKGEGVEIWEPRFVYHGFRYVEVTGFPGKPTLNNLRGRVVHTSFDRAGSFKCSNDLLNKIQKMTLWSYRSNFHGYPTDCPHYEKNGWTGDAHLAAEQAMYNFHNAASYTKWMNDFKDEQRQSGELPGIVPTSGWGYHWGNGPAWDSAYVIIPWYLYQYCGDVRILSEHYERLKRYVDYLTSKASNHIVSIGLGDWVPAKTTTPVKVTSTGYYYCDAVIVSKIARILGKAADAEKYSRLAENIQGAFNKEFYKGNGTYANDSQTALSCAVYQGLVTPEERDSVVSRLVANVEQKNGHIDTGILGAKYLFHTLTENDRVDLAYRIATQTTPPSYGYWVKQGATTLWESWLSARSLNHIMFGDISAWFYKALAGINPDLEQPGFKHIILRPQPVGDLQFVKAFHKSMYGTIVSDWKIKDGVFHWNVIIPVNTTVTIYVPTSDANSVTESGKAANKAEDIRFLRMEAGTAVFTAGSGKYRFVSKLPD